MVVFDKTPVMTDVAMHYCPGCGHGIAHRLVAEAIDELGLQNKCVGIAPVGCAVFIYKYVDVDMQEAAHGRAPAVATGVKRVLGKDTCVFTYQGDGDMASIGMAEIVHAANRGENITVFFLNNAIYGMTGGQMAPTTLVGQKTTTSPMGRDKAQTGSPLRMSELLATIDGAAYIERVALNTTANIVRAKRAVKKALQTQMDGKGFSMVEIVSTCPTNWGMTPSEAMDWVQSDMLTYFPLGVFKEA